MHIEHHQANIIILTDGINHRYFKIRIKWNNRNTYDSNFSANCLFKRVKCIEWWVSLENSQSNHGTNFLKFNLKYVLIIYIFEFAPPGFFFFFLNLTLFCSYSLLFSSIALRSSLDLSDPFVTQLEKINTIEGHLLLLYRHSKGCRPLLYSPSKGPMLLFYSHVKGCTRREAVQCAVFNLPYKIDSSFIM